MEHAGFAFFILSSKRDILEKRRWHINCLVTKC